MNEFSESNPQVEEDAERESTDDGVVVSVAVKATEAGQLALYAIYREMDGQPIERYEVMEKAQEASETESAA
jgi:hypothetical protein